MSGYYQPDPPPNVDTTNPSSRFYDHSSMLSESQKPSSTNVGRWFDLDSDASGGGPKVTARVRRRPPPGSDHVKHRRTRSGCYTCRSRRVKCDEQRPICERCKKGGRDCVYPATPSNTKSTSKAVKDQAKERDSEPSSSEYEDEEREPPPPLPEAPPNTKGKREPRPVASNPRTQGSAPKRTSTRSSQAPKALPQPQDHAKEKSLSPSAEESSNPSVSRAGSAGFQKLSSVSTTGSDDRSLWSHLPQHLQYYLDYHQNSLTYHHYFFKHDANHFVHTVLLEHALSYEPLLFAVVGFAAFHSTIEKPDGKIQDFLGFYNKSVSSLRKKLQAGEPHTDATMLTILQLAAFEEYLGDWVNLLGHQKAACGMLLELYSVNSIMQTEIQRKILAWYARFDLFAGLMSGSATVLGREWFFANQQYYVQKSQKHSNNIDFKVEAHIATHRLTAMDMALLFAKFSKGKISKADFTTENNVLAEHIRAWKDQLAPLLSNAEYLVQSFGGARDPDPEDIVDPYKPGGIYKGALWTINFMMIDWYAVTLMHKHQTALALQQQPPSELMHLALEMCRIFEAIEYWPESPRGSILTAQASLGIASVFLPKDEKHGIWCRRKLAMIESMGYTYPATFRSKMAELWGMPEVRHWWLPNDEGYPPIIRSIRSFIEGRTAPTLNQTSEDVRTLKAIFSTLSVDDSPKPNSPEMLRKAPAEFFHDSDPQQNMLQQEPYFPMDGLSSYEPDFNESTYAKWHNP